LKKSTIFISLTLAFALCVPVPAQENEETGSSMKDQMVHPDEAKKKKIILPDDHAGPLPMRVIEPVEEADYWAYYIPGLKKGDGYLNKVSDVVPFEFGGRLDILSDWINEGANAGPHHLNLQQTYWASYGGFTFEFFQADYFNRPHKWEWDDEEQEWVRSEDRRKHHTTLERDFVFSYEFTILDRLIFVPNWKIINLPGYKDTQEFGCAMELDIPLHPAVDWNWDYKEDPHHDGMWFEFSLSQPIDISPGGKRLCTFTPMISTGLNANKYIDDTIMTHINYGLEWEVPLGEHLSVFAYLNYLQGLNARHGYTDQYPWGGMGVQMKF